MVKKISDFGHQGCGCMAGAKSGCFQEFPVLEEDQVSECSWIGPLVLPSLTYFGLLTTFLVQAEGHPEFPHTQVHELSVSKHHTGGWFDCLVLK